MANFLAHTERLWTNLLGLGLRRLLALGLIGLAVAAVTGLAGYELSRPAMETLYAGLGRDDVAAIGSALREAGVAFDVNSESTTVLVPTGQAPTARMLLAEKGLPRSGAVGNELFDKLGSLGLTSFMQDVTRLRALEGELARTIQMMRSVKAARVHVVLADEGSFRRERQPASASVMIRTDGGDDRATGQAIRHLVAAAVPGMKIDDVTVLNVDGRLLASGSDSLDKSPDNLLALENEDAQEIRENVARTLTPYLSARNFQISVAARLNADKTQTSETIYNPDQRVERSVRVTKEQQSSQNAAGTAGGGRRGQPAQAAPERDGAEAVERQYAEARGADQLRGLLEVDPDDQRRLHCPEPVGRGADQSRRAGRVPQGQEYARGDGGAGQGDRGARVVGGRPRRQARRRRQDRGRRFRRFEPRPRAGAGAVDPRDRRAAAGLFRQRRRHRPRRRDADLVRHAPGHEDAARGARARLEAASDEAAEMAFPAPTVPKTSCSADETERDEFLEALAARRESGPERKMLKLVDFDEGQAATILKQWIRNGADA